VKTTGAAATLRYGGTGHGFFSPTSRFGSLKATALLRTGPPERRDRSEDRSA
jgi:hypothetical protein